VLIRNGVEEPLPAKATFTIEAGDVVSIRSPGGGGWGSAKDAARGSRPGPSGPLVGSPPSR